MEILTGVREHEPQFVFRRGENIGELAEDVAQSGDNRRRPTRTIDIECDVAHVEGEMIPDAEEASRLVIDQGFQELGAECLWVFCRGQSAVDHGDIVVQDVGIGREGGRQWFPRETSEAGDRNLHRGEEEVPGRSPGSRSVNPEGGIVW